MKEKRGVQCGVNYYFCTRKGVDLVTNNDHSKNVSFKNDCDKIRKSKSLKKKQDFLNQNLQSYMELIGKDFEVFSNNTDKKICTCLNWHPAIETNKGKKAVCSYCKKPRR